MFTGIVEELGKVSRFQATSSGGILWVESSFSADVELGESVAVNGACLTVTEADGGGMRFDLLHETLRLTNLGSAAEAVFVNLERSLRIGDRMSGHFVQGHVDACVEVLDYSPSGEDHRLEVALPEEFARLVAPKGSICLNGVSLTVAEITGNSVVAWIIPHTHQVTNLQCFRPGTRVNVEFDMLAKHLDRLLLHRQGGSQGEAR